jgi:hypothetical protein
MSLQNPLAVAISDSQRKHRVTDADPMIAPLQLVRMYLRQPREVDNAPIAPPPSFEDFRGTIRVAGPCSKSFASS